MKNVTIKDYIIGFSISIILTSLSFFLVMEKIFEKNSTTIIVILVLAAVQIVIHMIYFLHLNIKAEGGWSILSLIFTVMLVFIMLTGSIWIMYNLNHNMM